MSKLKGKRLTEIPHHPKYKSGDKITEEVVYEEKKEDTEEKEELTHV